MLNEIFAYERNVFYYETDKMGIVHHSNYIRWLEEARVSLLEQTGMPFEKIEEMGIMVPVLSAECEYKVPARFGDRFAVIPKIEKFNGIRLEVSYQIINPETKIINAVGRTTHCFVDMNMKPVRTKTKFPEVYKVFTDYLGYEVRLSD